MSAPAVTAVHRAHVSFRDGLGERTPIVESSSGDILEALWLTPDLAARPTFERSLRERVGRLIQFRHASYARIWRVEGEAGSPNGLALIAERPRGVRLADMLIGIEEGRVAYDLQIARSLVEQLVAAIASLHLVGRDVAHGVIGPERLIVTPHARLVIVEHVFGPALEQLELTRTQLWCDYRVAIPAAAGGPRVDQRADTLQIGMVALALLLGRQLREDEFPGRLPELIEEVSRVDGSDERLPLTRAFGVWLVRALQLDLRHSFQSAIEAQASLENVTEDEPRPGVARLPPPLRAVAADREASEPSLGRARPAVHGHDAEPALLAGIEPRSFEASRVLAIWLWRARTAGRLAFRAAAILTAVAAVVGLGYIAVDRYAGDLLPGHEPTVLRSARRSRAPRSSSTGSPTGGRRPRLSSSPGRTRSKIRPVGKPKPTQCRPRPRPRTQHGAAVEPALHVGPGRTPAASVAPRADERTQACCDRRQQSPTAGRPELEAATGRSPPKGVGAAAAEPCAAGRAQ